MKWWTQCHDLSFLNVEFFMTNLHSILKSRDTTLLTTVHIIKAIVFPAVMYRCENWTIKNAERQRIDASNCGAGEDSWSPLDCKEIQPVNPKGNQHWIFIAEVETPILWPPDVKNWLLEKTLMLGKIEDRRRRGWQRMRWLDGITDSMAWIWEGSGR